MFTGEETTGNTDHSPCAYGPAPRKMQQSLSLASAAAGQSDSSSTGSLSPPSRDRTSGTVMVSKSSSVTAGAPQAPLVAPGCLLPGPTPRHSIDAILGRTPPKTTMMQHNNVHNRADHPGMMNSGFQGAKVVPCKGSRLSDQEFTRDREVESDRDHDPLDTSGE